jgi:hypothetical protein
VQLRGYGKVRRLSEEFFRGCRCGYLDRGETKGLAGAFAVVGSYDGSMNITKSTVLNGLLINCRLIELDVYVPRSNGAATVG